MAHVSMIFNPVEKTIEYPKIVWVQISTAAKEYKSGLPVIVKNKEVQVYRLWRGDNGTCLPHDLLRKECLATRGENAQEFWTEFF